MLFTLLWMVFRPWLHPSAHVRTLYAVVRMPPESPGLLRLTLNAGITYDTAMIRIVLDTCVFVSALRSRRGASYELLKRVGTGAFEIALSVPLVIEYEDAGKRRSEETGLTEADIDDVLDYLCSVAHLQEIHFLWRPALKDPRDDHVLELAVEAAAETIVTHNLKDFAAASHFGVTVMSPGEFLESIKGGTS